MPNDDVEIYAKTSDISKHQNIGNLMHCQLKKKHIQALIGKVKLKGGSSYLT